MATIDNSKDELDGKLERLNRKRKTLLKEAYDLTHNDRRLSDAVERQSGSAGALDARRRDLKQGHQLVLKDIKAVEAEIAEISELLAETSDGNG